MTEREEDRELSDLRGLQDADLHERRKGADRQTGRDRSQADRDISAGRRLTDRRIAALRRPANGKPVQSMLSKLRDELLLNPYELPFSFSVLVVAIIFTLSPQTLEHSPIGFETRGIIHHLWHYALLLPGAVLNLVGRFTRERAWGLALEGIGLALLLGAVSLNFSAIMTAGSPLGGFGIVLRIALMVGIVVRLFIIIKRPTVDVGDA